MGTGARERSRTAPAGAETARASEAAGAADKQRSPETLGSRRAAKKRGENSGVATGRAGRVQRCRHVLRSGQGSTETVDHGKPASTLRWEAGETAERRKPERHGRVGETVGWEGTKLNPELHLKDSSPNFHSSSSFYTSSR